MKRRTRQPPTRKQLTLVGGNMCHRRLRRCIMVTTFPSDGTELFHGDFSASDVKTANFPSDGDMTEADRKKAQTERQRRAALRSSVIQELRQQYSDAPEEIRDRRDFQTERESRDELHRLRLDGFIAVCSDIRLFEFY